MDVLHSTKLRSRIYDQPLRVGVMWPAPTASWKVDLLYAMHANFFGGGLAGSALCRSRRYAGPRWSRCVWRKLMP
jgi:hypothetical protein